MKIGVLTIGNELTSGRVQDTNSSLICRAMQVQGWPVAAMMSVGDDDDAVREALDFLLARAEAVVVTGGLGPTADDITTAAIARAFGLGLCRDEAVLAHVRGLFEKRRIAWTGNNAKQADFPEGALVIPNPTGTAAGFAVRREGKIVAVIPGVPAEARRMLPEGVIPLFREAFPEAALHVETSTFKMFGIPEAAIDAALADADLAGLGVGLGSYPNFPENHLVLTARTASPEEAAGKLAAAGARVEARLGKYIFARGAETIEGIIAGLLTEKKLTLAVAESCTGGLITDRLTDIPGSSAFLERGGGHLQQRRQDGPPRCAGTGNRGAWRGERRDGAPDGRRGPAARRNRSGTRRDGDRRPFRRDRGQAGGDPLHRPGRWWNDPLPPLCPALGAEAQQGRGVHVRPPDALAPSDGGGTG